MTTGTDGNDNLTGTAGADSIDALGGNDTVHAGAGADTVNGSDGSDLIYGEDGDDLLYGGDDLSADSLYGGAGADTLVGQSGAEILDGGDGDDAMGIDNGNHAIGGLGDDYLQINESITGPYAHTVIDGGAGTDFVDFYYYQHDAEIWIDQVSTSGFELHDIEALGLGAAATVHGSAAGDFVFCQGAGALIVGGAGGDTLLGGDGDDRLNGGGGDDVLATGGGTNHLDAGAGDDVIGLSGANATVNGGAGFDYIDFRDNDTSVAASMSQAWNGWRIVGVEALLGSVYDDQLEGSSKADTLLGGDGDDRLFLTRGDDLIDGGDGKDIADLTRLKASLVDMAEGWARLPDGSVTTLVSIEQIDFGAGDDTVKAAGASGYLSGGDGRNTVSYEHLGQGVVVNLQDGTVHTADGTQSGDILNFDRLIGTGFADVLSDRGNFYSHSETIDGGGGDDTINAGAGKDVYVGGEGRDTLIFADNNTGITVDFGQGLVTSGWDSARISGFEWVIGTTEQDIFYAGQGNDGVDGLGGGDTFSYAYAKGAITFVVADKGPQDTGGSGIDQVWNVNTLIGSKFGDHLSTGKTAFYVNIYGGAGADLLDGSQSPGAGLLGDEGNDTLIGGKGDDYLLGGDGVDTVSYAFAKSAIKLDFTNMGLDSGQGVDVFDSIEAVVGSRFGDALTGDDHANRFDGGAGNDTLRGGEGADTLTGGAGKDVFVYKGFLDSLASARDLITDLGGADVIDLSGIDADGDATNGDTRFHLVASLDGHKAEAALVYDAGKDQTSLLLDLNGDKIVDQAITLSGDQSSFTNFVL